MDATEENPNDEILVGELGEAARAAKGENKVDGGLDIDNGESSFKAPTLDLHFINPAGNKVANNIKVTNAESFKFGWKAENVKSCEVFVSASSADSLGDNKNADSAVEGEIEESRIIVAHTYTAKCLYEDETGDEAEIEEDLEATIEGGWFNAYTQECDAFCSGIGKANVASLAGYKCASVEARLQASIGILNFSGASGCWHSCSAPEGRPASSGGIWCWASGQKRDYDRTDKTVGCYCK